MEPTRTADQRLSMEQLGKGWSLGHSDSQPVSSTTRQGFTHLISTLLRPCPLEILIGGLSGCVLLCNSATQLPPPGLLIRALWVAYVSPPTVFLRRPGRALSRIVLSLPPALTFGADIRALNAMDVPSLDAVS
jgi:hypothetical protein